MDSKADIRHDEEQQKKGQEIVELLVAAGYFRARIKVMHIHLSTSNKFSHLFHISRDSLTLTKLLVALSGALKSVV